MLDHSLFSFHGICRKSLPENFIPNNFAVISSWKSFYVVNCWVSLLLPPANVVCEGYVFTGVCLSTGGSASVHAGRPPLPGRPPFQGDPPSRPTSRGKIEGDQIQAHTQGRNWGGSDPGPHPRGKLRGIRFRPIPKGEIQGDQDQTPPPEQLLLPAVCILLECILVSII